MRKILILSSLMILILSGCIISINKPVRNVKPAYNEPLSDKQTSNSGSILNAENFRHYIDLFNRMEDENRVNHIPNSQSCEWDGSVWPFATSQTMTGMANLLNNYDQNIINDSVFFRCMEIYVESQYYRGRPYIGEYLDEKTGYWLKGDQERSRYYNHSTFCDLIITGIAGLRPRADDYIEVNPLLPDDEWDWFCLDGIKYHGKTLTICWDKYGTRYNRGPGFRVLLEGKEAGRSAKPDRIIFKL